MTRRYATAGATALAPHARPREAPMLEAGVPREVREFIISLRDPAWRTAEAFLAAEAKLRGGLDLPTSKILLLTDSRLMAGTANGREVPKTEIILHSVFQGDLTRRDMELEMPGLLKAFSPPTVAAEASPNPLHTMNALYYGNFCLHIIFDVLGSQLRAEAMAAYGRGMRKMAAFESLVRMIELASGPDDIGNRTEKLDVIPTICSLMEFAEAHGSVDAESALENASRRMETGGLQNVKTQYGGLPWIRRGAWHD